MKLGKKRYSLALRMGPNFRYWDVNNIAVQWFTIGLHSKNSKNVNIVEVESLVI